MTKVDLTDRSISFEEKRSSGIEDISLDVDSSEDFSNSKRRPSFFRRIIDGKFYLEIKLQGHPKKLRNNLQVWFNRQKLSNLAKIQIQKKRIRKIR